MISQTAPEGEPHFVLTMAEHTEMCGQMARAFGNDRFEPPAPFDEVVYTVENHDRGWDPYDANPGLDPATRVPDARCGEDQSRLAGFQRSASPLLRAVVQHAQLGPL
jgi:hypothetical protein